ncbi:MAG TPA: hypothetical protein VFS21_13685 [Roseiflexaceae bacterium]|nr:hypothetical protein [Roseiflexaceae bacterium]
MGKNSKLKTQHSKLGFSLASCLALAGLLSGCAAPPTPAPTPTPTQQNTFLPVVPATGPGTATPEGQPLFLPAVPAAEPTP